jgi:hypothetical protein
MVTPGGSMMFLNDDEHPAQSPVNSDIPFSCVSSVALSFSMLYLDREAHHNCAAQVDGLVDKLDRPHLDIADAGEWLASMSGHM